MYELGYSSKARKDYKRLKKAGLDRKADELIAIMKTDPFKRPPRYKKLSEKYRGREQYARNIDARHRFVYQVMPDIGKIYVISMYGHYGKD